MAGSNKNPPLPILVSCDELQSNPKLAQLLNILSSKISHDGVSDHLEKELEQAEISLSQARYTWLMSHIPYYELHELLSELQLKGVDRKQSVDEEQFKDVLSQVLATNETEHYLPLYSNPSSGSSLFGLTPVDVDRHDPLKHLIPATQQAVLPMLEDKLRKKCQELYDFFSSYAESTTVSDKLLLAKAQTLSQLVEEKQHQVSREKILLKETQAKKREHFLLYYQTLLECLSLMETLIKDYKCKSQLETDRKQAKYLKAQNAAFILKARVTQIHVVNDTYSIDNVKALKVIEKHLSTAIQRTERELTSTQQALNAYHTLGSDFKLLVKEYSHLKKEIDNCKWGLEQFLKTDRKPSVDSGQDLGTVSKELSGITLQGAGQGLPPQGDEESTKLDYAIGGVSHQP